MHDSREHLPIEWSFIAILWGFSYVGGFIGVWFLGMLLYELIFKPKNPRDAMGNLSRPFYTDAIKRLNE